jgi:hypothetical protein
MPHTALQAICVQHSAVAGLLESNSAKLVQQVLASLCVVHRSSIPQRVALWLLNASTLSRRAHLPVTHQQLAHLLAVRRSGVTLALHYLEDSGAIRSQRSSTQIWDAAKLDLVAKRESAVDRNGLAARTTSPDRTIGPDILRAAPIAQMTFSATYKPERLRRHHRVLG